MLALKLAFLFAALSGLSAGLCRVTEGAGGPWPIARAVLTGRDDGERDVRFLAFVAAVVALVTAALAFQDAVRAAGPASLALGLLLALPALALGLAAGADGWGRARARWSGDAVEPDAELEVAPSPADVAPTVEVAPLAVEVAPTLVAVLPAPPPAPVLDDEAPLGERLAAAQAELGTARARVADPALRRALGALDEVLGECEAQVADPARSGSLRARIDGVATLARALADDERREAARLLGVRPDASRAEAQAVLRALSPLYRGPAALPGVDPERAEALSQAASRLAA